jgi:hypothetical protein
MVSASVINGVLRRNMAVGINKSKERIVNLWPPRDPSILNHSRSYSDHVKLTVITAVLPNE